MLKNIDGKWALVSKKTNKPLVYYKGIGKPDDEWVKKHEKRIQFFKHKGETKIMQTYKDLMETKHKWSDIKDKKVRKEAGQFLKALDKGEVLGYSVEHDEFSIFGSEKDFKNAEKDKKMHWVQVEDWVRKGELIDEAFNFKSAVKLGMLAKSDEKYIDIIEKKKWEIYEFNLTSKGYEIILFQMSDSKKKQYTQYIGDSPSAALKLASKKVK